MSTLKNGEPCADIILDFIAGGVPDNPSGEAHGNYNAYFGHALSTVDLSMHTLSGIYDFQDTMLVRDRRSTAVGRYQFLRRTLKDLQKELGLSDWEPFTPVLQDRLGMQLLNRRGYYEWRRSAIDDKEFAHRLSMEWASLPDPGNNGRSHYDGDSAGNHASTTLDAVYAMLKQAEAAASGSAEPLPAPDPAPDVTDESDIDADLLADLVRAIQRVVDTNPDGIMGPRTYAAILEAQR